MENRQLLRNIVDSGWMGDAWGQVSREDSKVQKSTENRENEPQIAEKARKQQEITENALPRR
jgi:hypothetical protein